MSSPWNLPFGVAGPSADVQSGCAAGVPGAQPQVLLPHSSGGDRDHACQGETPVCRWAAGPYSLLGQQDFCSRQPTAAGVGRSLCFDRDSQIKAFVLRRHVMGKGNYTHLSALCLTATNSQWTHRSGGVCRHVKNDNSQEWKVKPPHGVLFFSVQPTWRSGRRSCSRCGRAMPGCPRPCRSQQPASSTGRSSSQPARRRTTSWGAR